MVAGPPSDNCVIRIEPVYDHAKGVNSQQFTIKSPYAIEITGFVWKNFNLENRKISDNDHNYRLIAYDKKDLKSNINVYISQECGLDGTFQLVEKNIEDDPERDKIKRIYSLDLDLFSPSVCNVLKFESADDSSIYGLSHPFIMYKLSSFKVYPPTILPNKDGTVTVHYQFSFDSDSVFDTLECDFDGDLIFEIEGNVDTPGTIYHYTHTFQEQGVYYSNFRAIINDQISADESVTVDARIVEANISVRITDRYSYMPITDFVKVLLDDEPLIGKGFGNYSMINPVMPATYKLSVDAEGYFPYTSSVLLVNGKNVIDIALEPFFEVPGYPFITSIRMYVPKGNLLGQEKEVQKPVFLSGVSIQWCRFKPNIIWSKNNEISALKIKIDHPFQGISEMPWEEVEKDGIKFDPAEFKVGDQLCFQAIGVEKSTNQTVSSEMKCADMEIVPMPIDMSMVWKDGKYVGKVDSVFNGLKKIIGSSLIPKEIPIIGNKETSFQIPINYSREVEINGKGKIMLGYEFANSSDTNAKQKKYFQFAGKRVPFFEKKKGNRRYLAEKGQGLSFTPSLNIDMEWLNDGWDFKGGFNVVAQGDWKTPPYYFWSGPPTPLSARLGLGIQMNATLNVFGLDQFDTHTQKNENDFNLEGSVGISPNGSLLVEAGASDILSVGVKGTVGLDWVLARTVNEFKNDKLDFILKCSAEVRALIFRQRIDISSCTWDLLNGTNDCGLKKKFNLLNLKSFSTEGFYLIPRDYLNESYQHTPDIKKRIRKTLSNNSPIETILIENVYPYSDATIANHNDDEITLLMITDDPKRSSANRTCLMAMNIKDQGQITNSIPVFDNGTADFHPSAVTLPDGKILALWNDSKTEHSDDIPFEEMLANVEIASAMFEPYSNTWISMGRLTDNNILDRKASLYVMPDGNVAAAWISNSFNAYLADKDHPDTVNIAIFQDGKWSSPQNIATANGAVSYFALGYHNDQLLIVWDEDTDGDLSTLEDRELFMCTQTENTWNSPQRLTNDNETDTFPNLLTTSAGDTLLIWGRSGNIVCAENFQLTQTTIIAENIGTTAMADFKVIPRKPAGASLIWTDVYEKGGSNVFVALYDDHEKLWGVSRQLISDIDMEQRLDGIYQKDNMFWLIYNKVRLKEDVEYGLVPDKTDLAMLTFNEGNDIAIENLEFSNETPIPFEKIVLYATVINRGETVMNNIPVEFLVGDTVIATQEITEPVAPGKTKEISAQCTLPETPGITITVRVDPDHIFDDKDLSNNYISKNAIKPNITARGTTYEMLPDHQMRLKAEILNRGSTDAGQFMITLVQVNNNREIVYEKELIKGLMISEIQERRWNVPQGKYILYLDFNDTIDEDDENDNIYGYNTSPMPDEPFFLTPEIFDHYHSKLSIYIPVGYTDVNSVSWDLDNDGEFEFQTADNIIDYTFANSGIYNINATLHRDNGQDIVFNGISIRVYNCDGDFDSNGSINLADIIYGLRIIANEPVSVKSACCDVDNDQHIGLGDVIYTFKLIAGLQ